MTKQHDSLADIRRLAVGELSMKARLGYVALMLAAAVMTTVIVALWLTERELPARTQIAFGAMSLVGGSWLAFATWALTTRRILFARDRVIAGKMAVTFTALFAASALAAVIAGNVAAVAAFATGVAMLAVAIAVLRRARQRFAELSARRAALERQLGDAPG